MVTNVLGSRSRLLSQFRHFCVGQGLRIGDRFDGGNLSSTESKVQ